MEIRKNETLVSGRERAGRPIPKEASENRDV